MKVLVILHRDVYNIPTYHIVKEMLNRKYEIDFYAVFMNHNHLRMFDDLKINIQNISKMTTDVIDQYDFVYSAIGLRGIPQIFDIKKYIFSFSTAYMDDIINYGDYTFTQRDFGIHLQDYYYAIDINNEIKSKPGLVVGNPKFDFDYSKLNKIDDRKILFIDAGHFPFGKNGKMEEAKMLLDIAKKFPEYQIVIKPRFLPEDSNVTHRNKVHLYNCINEVADNNIPSNLHCLYQHVDLEELVRTSRLVITPDLTTSYLDIVRYDKAGLIATGLPSEYTLTHNKDHIKRFKNIEQRSGLCVYYKDICNYIPQGKKCNKEHIIEMGLDKRNVSMRIVDTMEKLYRDYISKNRYPSLDGDSCISFEKVMSFRYIRALFGIYEFYESRMESLDLTDIDNQLREYYKTETLITYEEYKKLQSEITNKVNQKIMEEKELFLEDEINRGSYVQALYASNSLDKCHDKRLQKDALYYYFWGKYFSNIKKEYKKGIEYMQKYFELTEKNDYEKTVADVDYFKESATYWIAFCYYQMNEYDSAKIYFQKCQELTSNNHKKAKEYLEMIDRK